MPKVDESIMSLDTETTGLDLWHSARPFCVTTCDGRQNLRWWTWPVDPLTRKVLAVESDLDEVQAAIDSCDRLVGQNLKFDHRALSQLFQDHGRRLRWDWPKVEDTLVAGHLLASNQPHDLTSMVLHYLGKNIQPKEVALGKACNEARRLARKQHPDWLIAAAGVPGMPSAKKGGGSKARESRGTEKEYNWKYDCWLPRTVAEWHEWEEDHPWHHVLEDYANTDSGSTLALWFELERQVRSRKLWKIYREQMRLLAVIPTMEWRGVTCSGRNADELEQRCRRESAEAAVECLRIAASYQVECKDCEGTGLADQLFDVDCRTCGGVGKHPCRLELPRSGVNGSLRWFCFEVLKLPPVRNPKARSDAPSLDKDVAIPWYLANLPEGSPELRFLQALLRKRGRDTSGNYVQGYRRYWQPLVKDGKFVKGWFVLHPSLNNCGTDTLRLSSSNPNAQNVCVDAETEFLTSRGWVAAPDLTDEMAVAQYWKGTGEIDFTYPDEIHRVHFAGMLQHITTDLQIDMMLTPAHRCLLRNRSSGRFKDHRADEFKNDCHHIHGGTYAGCSLLNLTEDQVIWLCAVQADGSYCKVGGLEYGIKFGFRKKRKIKRLRACMQRMGVRFTERQEKKGVSFYVGKHDPIVRFTKDLMPDKCFGWWLLNCNRTILDEFCEEVFQWDGCATIENAYSSSIKKNADWVQILWALSGSSASVISRPTPCGNMHHYVNLTKHQDYSFTSNHSRTQVPHDGLVWCVSVPSSYVMIRRNGKMSVTGNSKKKEVNLRAVFGPAPGREWWSLDCENIELRIPAYESGQRELIDLFERPDEPPFYGSEHLLNFSVVYPKEWQANLARQMVSKDHIKQTYGDTLYQRVKNGDFAIQYGAVNKAGGTGTADRTFGKPGAQALLERRFSNKTAVNRRWVDHATRTGMIETMPDRLVDPSKGYPLLVGRGSWGIKPTTPLSYRVSGTACWVLRRAMVKVEDQLVQWRAEGFDGWMILNVHDELVYDLPKGKGEEPWRTNLERIRIIKRLMESCGDDLDPQVPTPVAVTYHAEHWGEGINVKV